MYVFNVKVRYIGRIISGSVHYDDLTELSQYFCGHCIPKALGDSDVQRDNIIHSNFCMVMFETFALDIVIKQ